MYPVMADTNATLQPRPSNAAFLADCARLQVVSTMANKSIAEVASTGASPLFFQVRRVCFDAWAPNVGALMPL